MPSLASWRKARRARIRQEKKQKVIEENRVRREKKAAGEHVPPRPPRTPRKLTRTPRPGRPGQRNKPPRDRTDGYGVFAVVLEPKTGWKLRVKVIKFLVDSERTKPRRMRIQRLDGYRYPRYCNVEDVLQWIDPADPPVRYTNIVTLALEAANERAKSMVSSPEWVSKPSVFRALQRIASGKGLTFRSGSGR